MFEQYGFFALCGMVTVLIMIIISIAYKVGCTVRQCQDKNQCCAVCKYWNKANETTEGICSSVDCNAQVITLSNNLMTYELFCCKYFVDER